MLKLITGVLLGLILTYSQSVFSATPRTALVIGNAAYQEGPLSAPVRDARALAEVLRKLDFQVIERTNLDLAQMKQAIGEFHQILSQRLGVGLFYYSGHGIQYQNQNYLIPIGTSQSLYATYPLPKKNLAVNEVLAAMNSAGNPVNLVFLDSCRTSPEVVKSWAKGQAIPPGMAKQSDVPGSLIAYAAAPGKVALEGKKGQNSPYVKQLLRWIQVPNLSIADALNEVRRAVIKATHDQQQPHYSNALNEKFSFSPRHDLPDEPDKMPDEPDKMLQTCLQHFQANRLTRGVGGTALSCYSDILKKDPNNAEALAGLEKIEAIYVVWIESALNRGQKEKVLQYITGLRQVNPESPKLKDFEDRMREIQPVAPIVSPPEADKMPDEADKMPDEPDKMPDEPDKMPDEPDKMPDEPDKMLQTCLQHFQANRLTRGVGGTALSCYSDILKKDPNNAEALAGLEKIEAIYVAWIESALNRGQKEKVLRYMAGLRQVNPEYPKLKDFEDRMQETQPVTPIVSPPKSFSPDQVFRDRLKDGSEGPEMVWIPAGPFQMGDIQGGGSDSEKPVHSVSITQDFAMGRYEVTFAEYDKFAEATGRKKPEDEGWGRDNRPVINVSWDDAVAYTQWLSQQTGQKYRLPTEAQWEYAARGGTDTKYWWGNEIGKNRAACDGCGAKWGWDAKRMTAPVGSFMANPFGLHDTVGNVWEWTQDRYSSKYYSSSPPHDPSGPSTGRERAYRGGGWLNVTTYCRAANRARHSPDNRYNGLGFRLLRLP